jgi:hypothetical protein
MKNSILTWLWIVGIPICIIAASATQIIAQEVKTIDEGHQAVRMLWSEDDHVRQLGIKWIINLGDKAKPALVSLIKDLAAEPGKARFATGWESEGRRAMRKPTPKGEAELDRYAEVMRREINLHLEQDACQLIGRLRLVEAVPALIYLMEAHRFGGNLNAMSYPMLALIDIGSAAIPALIQSMVSAEAKGAGIDFADSSSEEQNEIHRRGFVAIIRARVALILGRIGDPAALPVLETTLADIHTSQCQCAEEQLIIQAIERIKKDR